VYQAGDRVIYGMHGVCRIMEEELRTVERKQVHYLVLEPTDQAGSRYLVPTHNAAAMAKLRKILTPEEMESLICSDAVRCGEWIRDENQRKQHYRALSSGGDRTSLLQAVYLLYRHKEAQLACGRKIHLCDENFLRDAEKMICGELCVVLGMTSEEARIYLREKLK